MKNEFNSILTYNDGETFWARIKIPYTIYLKDGFGIYSVIDMERYDRITIKGNTVEPLIMGSFYQVKLQRKFNKIRNQMDIEILEAYEDKFRDDFESTYYLMIASQTLPKHLTEKQVLDARKRRVKKDKYVKEIVGYNLNYRDAKRLVGRFGGLALKFIHDDPYSLLDMATYITFKQCDDIANRLGYNIKSSIRICSAIRESVKDYCNETGHTCCPTVVAIRKAKEKLDYYLSTEEMYELANNTDDYFDYTVFNLSNIVCLAELKSAIKSKQSYLFAEVETSLIDDEVHNMGNMNKFETDYVDNIEVLQLAEVIDQEINIARSINAMNNAKDDLIAPQEILKEIKAWEKKNKISLTNKQKDAILKVLSYKKGGFFVINGSAGTGKTTVVRAILDIQDKFFKMGVKIQLAAPTGRAANVLRDSVGLPAVTIHKLLGYDPETNTFYATTDRNWLKFQTLIVDETSMLDTWLCSCLLESINPDEVKVIFLGDDRQLPSVGPGSVLKDILATYPEVITLDEVKRQGANSGILENAINILNERDLAQFNDSRILVRDKATDQIGSILAACKTALTKYNPMDVQVLIPMKNGIMGTRNLNRLLQPIFNPNYTKSAMKIEEGESYIIDGKYYKNYFHVGDKVISNQNVYGILRYDSDTVKIEDSMDYLSKFAARKDVEIPQDIPCGYDVTNGEIGEITDIRECDILVQSKDGNYVGINHVTRIVVKYPSVDGKSYDYVYYDDNSDAISLAYAITIHKSQGSSWPCTITAVHRAHTRMISNELLYVAATRASALNCFIYDRKCFLEKITYFSNNRKTFLQNAIKKKL